MRILYLSQLIPYPADAGPKVRIYHVLQYLAQVGHEITFVAFRRIGDKPEAIDHLRKYCKAVHTVIMHRSRPHDAWHLARSTLIGQPFLISRDNVTEMYYLLSDLLSRQHFDAIHADQLWMAQYGLAAKNLSQSDAKPLTVLDQHNAVFLVPQRLAVNTSNWLKRAFLRLESRKLARYELETCGQFDRIIWVTDEDRTALARIANGHMPAGDGLVIPICVDVENRNPVGRAKHAKRVTFLGGMHWPPNAEGVLWFTKEVWSSVIQAVPDATLTIIGKRPPSELNGSINNLELTGFVDDLEPYLVETAAFIVPLHAGGGMRVKIVDAWAWGVPVVSTNIGAEGLKYHDGSNIMLADKPEDFAQAVVRLLKEPGLRQDIAESGLKTVKKYYDWRTIYQAWDAIYLDS